MVQRLTVLHTLTIISGLIENFLEHFKKSLTSKTNVSSEYSSSIFASPLLLKENPIGVPYGSSFFLLA